MILTRAAFFFLLCVCCIFISYVSGLLVSLLHAYFVKIFCYAYLHGMHMLEQIRQTCHDHDIDGPWLVLQLACFELMYIHIYVHV